jgi:hypothetical protein
MSLDGASLESALGLIRAHDQASVDQFLAFAEAERGRLEHTLAEAERRCVEAEAAYEAVATENRHVASELFGAWQELQAEREHAALTVNERLQAVRTEADERIEAFRAGGQIPAEHLEETVAHMVAPVVAQGWVTGATAPGEAPDAEPPLTMWSEPAQGPGAQASTTAAAPLVSSRFAPAPTIQVQQAPATPVTAALPVVATAPIAPPTEAAASDPEHQQFQEFWTADGTTNPPRPSEREGLITALLPMLALVIVLVVVLAWIG